MHKFHIPRDKTLSKVEQVAKAIRMDIEKGLVNKNDQLPTINEFSVQYKVARDTIEKAYNILKREGYIESIKSRGYFVLGKKDQRLKVLLVFNKLSSYKKIVYDSFIKTLGDQAKVDLQIHHYNPQLFQEIIGQSTGMYHYYVIMPHFFHDARKKEYLETIGSLPENSVVILDKQLPEFGNKYRSVFQDFRQDIFEALESASDLMKKYNRLGIIFPGFSNHPMEIVEGASHFCVLHQKTLTIISSPDSEDLQKGTAYIVITESDLARLIKKTRHSNFELGKDIGIISFNETELKELLNITVITTDFEAMGRTAAHLILEQKCVQVKNPFTMIRRESL